MRTVMAAMIAFGALAGPALADSCKATASEKKLAGAALNSFMKRCQTDAQSSCDMQASEKKRAGAASGGNTLASSRIAGSTSGRLAGTALA